MGKNIFATITHVAEKIKEAFSGHNGDKNAHSDMRNQINVLSGKVDWKQNNWKEDTALPTEYPNNQTTVFLHSGATQFGGYNECIVETLSYNPNVMIQKIYAKNGNLIKYRMSGDSVWQEWKQLATTDEAILVTPTGLARTESTTTRAVYTVPHNIAHKTTYHFNTGSSPSGSVETIIFRTPQGDYTLKIADTNVVDTMSNATWSDFNAGLDVFVYFTEKDTVKAAVITQASYGTVQKKITDNVKKINNSDNWNAGNTKPKDYINLFKPNGARKCTDLGLPATAGYWTSVLGINNYNGDTGVTEVALTDKQNIFFRTQVGTSKMENWNGANWKELATTDNAMVRYNLGSKEILNDTNHRKPYTTTIIGSVAQEIGLPLEYYNIIYQPNVQSNGYGTQIAIQMNSGKMFSRGSSGSVWNAWKELVTTDILKPVLLANGVFRRGDTITLSQSVSNFSKLLVMSGDAGGTPYPLNTNVFVGFNYPSTISSSQDVIYAGSHSTGIIKFTTKSGGTQVVLNELTGGYIRKIYGYVEGV